MSGGLLLCSSKRGEQPFVLREAGSEFWSLEELCRELYENAYEVTEELFSPELLRYLAQELELVELAAELEAGRRANRSFVWLILKVCRAANYYTEEELVELEERLTEFGALSQTQRAKRLADSCMERQLYARALREYERLLADRSTEPDNELFTGRVYHNMGAACGKMLLYREAEEYLKQACKCFEGKRGGDELAEQTRRELLLLHYLSENRKAYEETGRSFTREERQDMERQWEECRAGVLPGEGRSEAVIERWKQEYRRQMGQ